MLVQEGRGDPAVDGGWLRNHTLSRVRAIYEFHSAGCYQAERVSSRSVRCWLESVWLDDQGKRVETPEYAGHQPPSARAGMDGAHRYVTPAPEGRRMAQLELHVPMGGRWQDCAGATRI